MKRLRSVKTVSNTVAAQFTTPRGLRQASTFLQSQSPSHLCSTQSSNFARRIQLPNFSNKSRYASSTQGVSQSIELKKTALYDLHVAHGAKMVPFAGYHMPVQYDSLSVGESHNFTRTHASLFDVSHMRQMLVNGKGATAFLERLTPSDIAALKVNTNTLSTFLWPKTGGIVDDTIITKLSDESFYIVTNAGTAEKFVEYFEKELQAWNTQAGSGSEVIAEALAEKGLIALQGPNSQEILQSLVSGGAETDGSADLSTLSFGETTTLSLQLEGPQESLKVAKDIRVTRGGYTGEDGFEISVPADEVASVVETILSAGPVQLAGLGARDSLRLEAGMCLYGHDINDSITPVEAGLSWIIGKRRKEAKDFHGAEVIVPQMSTKKNGGTGVERRRVGLIVEGAPAREGAEIVDENGQKIGNITSGCPSPTLKQNIAMGYIKSGFHKAGTDVLVVVRGKQRKATVTRMPFVPSKYYRIAEERKK